MFESNYANYNLERESVTRCNKYWEQPSIDYATTPITNVNLADFDDLVDLSFQNYFDGGHNRISAYQGLRHEFNMDHETLGFKVNNQVFGYLYIDWKKYADQDMAYFNNLFCAPAVRRKGIAHQLIDAGINSARRKGFAKVSGLIMGSHEHCERIAQMLDRHNFKVDSVEQMSATWLDVTMVKNL